MNYPKNYLKIVTNSLVGKGNFLFLMQSSWPKSNYFLSKNKPLLGGKN
jgi:hypothetical protein